MADGTLSRRELLKRAGIVGAAAWAAPVLTSVPADAATARKRCKRGIDCNGTAQFCKPKKCVCATDAGGSLVCVGCVDLDCGSFPKCKKNADCPNGSRCLVDACCKHRICVSECGNPCPPSRRTRERSWTRA